MGALLHLRERVIVITVIHNLSGQPFGLKSKNGVWGVLSSEQTSRWSRHGRRPLARWRKLTDPVPICPKKLISKKGWN